MLGNRLENNRQEPLREFNRPVHFPHAAVRFHRFRRDDKYDRVGLRNQAAKARLPVLARLDIMAVEKWRKAEFAPLDLDALPAYQGSPPKRKKGSR